jgi:hypothetical protein
MSHEKHPPVAGERWKERDSRLHRVVTVVAVDPTIGKVTIEHKGRYTVADLKRFSGKHGGYSRHEND